MGTPALPMADSTAMKNHVTRVPVVSSNPAFCMTNREVTRMKAAQPFMLMVVQMGRTKRETEGFALRFCSAEARVTGRVAAELLVKSATATAGDILRKTWRGFSPRRIRKRGNTRKNWMKLPPSTTMVYFPRAPMMTPASIWAESCAENARMPMGRTLSRPRMRMKRSS